MRPVRLPAARGATREAIDGAARTPTRSRSGCSSSARARPGSRRRSGSASSPPPSPDAAERLGEVPVAVLEKGKAPGSHLLSGAVIDPAPLAALLGERAHGRAVPSYGEVPGRVGALPDAVAQRCRCRPPPTMRNHGQLGRLALASSAASSPTVAEEGGATILPETAATAAARRRTARVVGRPHRRQGAAAATARSSATSSRAPTSARSVTILAEGTPGT